MKKSLLIFAFAGIFLGVRSQTIFDLQGHRGCRGLMPENTIPAFLKALDLRVMTLELDVVITGDQQVLVSHDPYMNSLFCLDSTGKAISKGDQKSYRIYGMTMDQIRKFDCGMAPHPDFPEQLKMKVTKPTLAEVFEATENYAKEKRLPPPHYNIEIKSSPDLDGTMTPAPEEFVRMVVDVVRNYNIGRRANLQSFDFRPLRILHEKYPEIRLAMLISNPKSLAANVEELGFVPEIYSPFHMLVSRKTVREAHKMGMRIIPWTVNNPKDMKKLRSFGVDGLITDYPDRE
jgi:glycerophosphoryl diester phosphodiesterase